MTLLEAAQRLAESKPHHGGLACPFCDMPDGCHSGFKDTHRGTCPFLAMPRIVVVLEAAERVVELTPHYAAYVGGGATRHCRYCARPSFDPSADRAGGHEPDCPWRVLVAALRGEQVTA